MQLSMAVRAQKHTLVEFAAYAFPTARVTSRRYAEVLLGRIPMMELQHLNHAIVSASLTSSALVSDGHFANLLSSLSDGVNDVRFAIAIRSLLFCHF